MRLGVVIVVSVERDRLWCRFPSGNGIVLLMPLLDVGVSHGRWKRRRIIAWRSIDTGLRNICNAEFAELDGAFRSLKTRDLRRLACESQPHIDGNAAVLKKNGMHVGHIAPVLPMVDASKR